MIGLLNPFIFGDQRLVRALLIAGGGRGFDSGGNHGGVLEFMDLALAPGTYPATVGLGGTLSVPTGGDTIFAGITVTGGQPGTIDGAGSPIGRGGIKGAPGVGGSGSNGGDPTKGAGGGAGAGENGGNGDYYYISEEDQGRIGGKGGDGIQSDITRTLLWYAGAGAGGPFASGTVQGLGWDRPGGGGPAVANGQGGTIIVAHPNDGRPDHTGGSVATPTGWRVHTLSNGQSLIVP